MIRRRAFPCVLVALGIVACGPPKPPTPDPKPEPMPTAKTTAPAAPTGAPTPSTTGGGASMDHP